MSYNKLSKKELLDICENLKLTSYKTKNKPELIKMIEEKNKPNQPNKQMYIIEELEDNDLKSDSDSDTDDELKDIPIINRNNKINNNNNVNDDINTIIGGIENIVLENYEEKLKRLYEKRMDELYQMLHKANIRALNYQFKYRSQYPIVVYNNLESLKKRINVYNV